MLTLLALFIGLSIAGKSLAWLFAAILAYEVFIETPYRVNRKLHLQNRKEQRLYSHAINKLKRNIERHDVEKHRRELLKKLVDEVLHRQVHDTLNDRIYTQGYRRDMIIRMIDYSDHFDNEEDVRAICKSLDDNGHQDPFLGLELKYGEGTFNGKRLKLLTDARVTDYAIRNSSDVENYIYSIWGDKNGLKAHPLQQ